MISLCCFVSSGRSRVTCILYSAVALFSPSLSSTSPSLTGVDSNREKWWRELSCQITLGLPRQVLTPLHEQSRFRFTGCEKLTSPADNNVDLNPDKDLGGGLLLTLPLFLTTIPSLLPHSNCQVGCLQNSLTSIRSRLMADIISNLTPSGADTSNNEAKKLINLLRGWPSPDLLPSAPLRLAADYVLADRSIAVPVLQYGIDPGYQPLREELARWLTAQYGFFSEIKVDEIAITGGASQSLACVLQSFTDPGYTRAVWAVAPCYFMACPIFEDSGFWGRLRAVPEDEEGVDVEALRRGLMEMDAKMEGEAVSPSSSSPSYHLGAVLLSVATMTISILNQRTDCQDHSPPFKPPVPHLRKLYRHVIYLVATSANPSGKTLSLARREALVHLARKHDALIISDDVYDLLQWPTNFPPPSSSLEVPVPPSPLPPILPTLSQLDALLPYQDDPSGSPTFSHAISNGSFSKLVGPGMRTGWIHASPAFAAGFAHTGTNRSGGAASQFAAAIVWRMMAVGDLQRHLDGVVRPLLRRRHALMGEVVGRVLGPLGVRVCEGGVRETGVFGGYFLWLKLPGGLDAEMVAERAREEEELVVAPGKLFEVTRDEAAARFPGHVRLCFSWEEEENIVEGVERLGSVVRRMLDGDGGAAETGGKRTGEVDKFK